jgi:hypothetical protein
MSKTSPPYTTMLVKMGKKNYVKDTAQSKKEPAKKNITLNLREVYITCSIPRDGTNYYVCILYGCRTFA